MQVLQYNLAGDGLRTQSWLSPACSGASHVKGRSILLCVQFDYDVAMFYQRGVSSFTRSLQAPRKLHKPRAHTHNRKKTQRTRTYAPHACTHECMHDAHTTTHENTRQFTFMTYTCDDIHCDSVYQSLNQLNLNHVQAPRASHCTALHL